MRIPPKYTITEEMSSVITKIDALRYFMTSHNISPIIKEKIHRTSLLKSSLFSARIEGNPLKMEEIIRTEENEKKLEVFNILKALQLVDRLTIGGKIITLTFLKQIHKEVVRGLRRDAGILRKEASAIFNQAGVAIYVPPPHISITSLLEQLLLYVNTKREKFPLICAFIAHLVFEKIHPFLDGNGRVGRLFTFAVLKRNNYDFGISIPFEEYLDKHKEDYYYYLDTGMKDPNSYLFFMLNAFLSQCEQIKETLIRETNDEESLNLPPRQEEIFNIIRDHRMISFDYIRRRFLKVPERTLRYDLKRLYDQNYILKIGKTKGSFYKIKPRFR